VASEVVEGATRRDHVDEAEQRGAQGLVGGGVVHGPAVERLERMPRGGREPRVQLAPDPLGFALERVRIDHATVIPPAGFRTYRPTPTGRVLARPKTF
jgi:hypothetical protein